MKTQDVNTKGGGAVAISEMKYAVIHYCPILPTMEVIEEYANFDEADKQAKHYTRFAGHSGTGIKYDGNCCKYYVQSMEGGQAWDDTTVNYC